MKNKHKNVSNCKEGGCPYYPYRQCRFCESFMKSSINNGRDR